MAEKNVAKKVFALKFYVLTLNFYQTYVFNKCLEFCKVFYFKIFFMVEGFDEKLKSALSERWQHIKSHETGLVNILT